MSSKKDDAGENQVQENDAAPSAPAGDWRPDYFPTSPKPIFLKISALSLSILILCLFLAYCSDPKDQHKNNVDTQNNSETSSDNESDLDSPEIFD
jgi:hypothetical protein